MSREQTFGQLAINNMCLRGHIFDFWMSTAAAEVLIRIVQLASALLCAARIFSSTANNEFDELTGINTLSMIQ